MILRAQFRLWRAADGMKELNPHLLAADTLMGGRRAVLITAMADADKRTASGANLSFDLTAEYLGWEITGRLLHGGGPERSGPHRRLRARQKPALKIGQKSGLALQALSFTSAPHSRPTRRR